MNLSDLLGRPKREGFWAKAADGTDRMYSVDCMYQDVHVPDEGTDDGEWSRRAVGGPSRDPNVVA